MSTLITMFFILTLGAGMMGFHTLTGASALIAQFLTVVFVLLFVGSIFYSIITRRYTRVPLP